MEMSAGVIHDYARELFAARGAKAISEAAEKARRFEKQGDREQAAMWRLVEDDLKSLRGPHAS
jgi:hypothetical protein